MTPNAITRPAAPSIRTASGMPPLLASLWIVLAVLAVLAGGCGDEDTESYRFVTVEQGDLESIVTSTGILGAETTVQVGTQVSGIIAEIRADFNDSVREGEILAVIDTTLLASAVAEAQAALDRNIAQMRLDEVEFERARELLDQTLVSKADYQSALYQLEASRATVRSSEVALKKARQNLSYATITSPINGTVVDRAVDVGQTVAASLSAPELFLIADLSSMQILTTVDESDIGRIRQGMPVRFTVQAFANETFHGTVRQVRLQSQTEENVVNYIVVVDVAEHQGRLLPGMTATVDFITETAEDVLMVSNAAIRFRPTEAMQAELQKMRQERQGQAPDSLRRNRMRPADGAGGGSFAVLFSLDAEGNLTAHPVRTGLSDGKKTVIQGRDLSSGLQVIAGIASNGAQSASNPFQSNQESRRPGPPGPI